jgi:hypothetical protein
MLTLRGIRKTRLFENVAASNDERRFVRLFFHVAPERVSSAV